MFGQKTGSADIADFYHQLSLLIRSNLPLPASLRQIGSNFSKKEFREVIEQLAARTEQGEKLAVAMKEYPRFFDPFHIRLVSSGESANALPEALFVVAKFARFCQMVAVKMHDTIAYPLLTINITLIIISFLSFHVIPSFAAMFSEMLGNKVLPGMTGLVLGTGMFIKNHAPFVILMYACFTAASIWLFTPTISAHRALMFIIDLLPGSGRIIHSLDSARICAMLSAFLHNRIPLPEALENVSELLDKASSRQSLKKIAHRVTQGTPFITAAAGEKAVDELILLTFDNCAEEDLPQDLMELGLLYEHRVALSVRTAGKMWAAVAFMFTSILVGTVVVAMFMPLISIMSELA